MPQEEAAAAAASGGGGRRLRQAAAAGGGRMTAARPPPRRGGSRLPNSCPPPNSRKRRYFFARWSLSKNIKRRCSAAQRASTDPLRASCTQIARSPAQVDPGHGSRRNSRAASLPGHAVRHLARGAHAQPVCGAGRRDSLRVLRRGRRNRHGTGARTCCCSAPWHWVEKKNIHWKVQLR